MFYLFILLATAIGIIAKVVYDKIMYKKTQTKAIDEANNYSEWLKNVADKNGGSNWGTCENCSSVYDTDKFSRCPSCGGKLIKVQKIKLKFTQLEYRFYIDSFQNRIGWEKEAVPVLVDFWLTQIAMRFQKITDDQESYTFRCDYCGAAIKIDNNNCPNCGAPFGKDIEFIKRNRIMLEDDMLSINEDAMQELYMNAYQILYNYRNYKKRKKRKKPIPYSEEMRKYLAEHPTIVKGNW